MRCKLNRLLPPARARARSSFRRAGAVRCGETRAETRWVEVGGRRQGGRLGHRYTGWLVGAETLWAEFGRRALGGDTLHGRQQRVSFGVFLRHQQTDLCPVLYLEKIHGELCIQVVDVSVGVFQGPGPLQLVMLRVQTPPPTHARTHWVGSFS